MTPNFYFSQDASFSSTDNLGLPNENYLHASSSWLSYTMIYFNNPASTFNITILINSGPKRPASKRPTPKSHVPLF